MVLENRSAGKEISNPTRDMNVFPAVFRCCKVLCAELSGRVVKGDSLQPIACRDCGFEYRQGHGCLSVVIVVLLGRDICGGPIPRPEESCRLWCVFVC